MLRNSRAIHVEYPISEADAAQFTMSRTGRTPNLDFTGRPAVYRPAPGACSGSNCGLWAIGEIERQTSGTVGRVSDPAGITSMGRDGLVTPNRASQPAVRQMAIEGLRDPASIRPLTPGAPTPTVSAMPRVVRVLRVGGKVMMVVGVVAGAYEILSARPEEQGRVATGVAGGFAGGFLLGATAGLLCGPGALACSFVLGLTFGTVGALVGRAGAEALFDFASGPPPSSPESQSSTGAASSAPARSPQESWEMLFTPPPEPVDILFGRAQSGSALVRPATSLDLAFAQGSGL